MPVKKKTKMQYFQDDLVRLHNIITGTNKTAGEIIRESLARSGTIEDSLHRLTYGGDRQRA
jgi:hypothetical protein